MTRASGERERGDGREPAPPSSPQSGLETVDGHEQKESNVTLSTSQRLWNAAYDSLEKDEGELVGLYIKTLEIVLCSEASGDPSEDDASVAAKLKDPNLRQIHMQMLVKKGQEKVANASKITKAVGDFAKIVLDVKPIVDLAVQAVPQAAPAALPWAGVCIGLQVRLCS